jgi:hypothetical protein
MVFSWFFTVFYGFFMVFHLFTLFSLLFYRFFSFYLSLNAFFGFIRFLIRFFFHFQKCYFFFPFSRSPSFYILSNVSDLYISNFSIKLSINNSITSVRPLAISSRSSYSCSLSCIYYTHTPLHFIIIFSLVIHTSLQSKKNTNVFRHL